MLERPTLLLGFEPPAACFARLQAEGFTESHAREISSYLDQSTDMLPEFDALREACAARGLHFLPAPLDEMPAVLARCEPAHTLVWTLTDGIAFFRGGAVPAMARLGGFRTFGAEDALFALAQDKFRSGAVLAAAGMPVPPAGLARDGRWLVPPPQTDAGWFVKPNRLGAKVGIWADSRCRTEGEALELSRRIFAAYRDDALVQAYVPGRNVRASFLAVEPDADAEQAGIALVDSGGDFQTMEDSLALYGDTGGAAKTEGRYAEPALVSLRSSQPEADKRIRDTVAALMPLMGLCDVFSLDFRVTADDAIHLLEFEVCPGLPCFDFRGYCRSEWKMDLAEAMARAAANRLLRF